MIGRLLAVCRKACQNAGQDKTGVSSHTSNQRAASTWGMSPDLPGRLFRKLLSAALLLPLALAAQMKLYVVPQGVEEAVGTSYEVGTAAAGEYLDTTFRVRNTSILPAWLQGLNLAGARFSFPSLPKLPVLVAGGEEVEFVVRFTPLDAVSYYAYLNVNGVTTLLTGTGLEPKPPEPPAPVELPDLPDPRIVVDPPALRGGQQAKVAIRLASVSKISANGQLSMEFTPSVAGKGDDSAVLFAATGSRGISFTVAAGEDLGRFSGGTDTEFQTGTTAGVITFTVKLGPYTEQFTAEVPRAPVVVASARSARVTSGIEVQVTGFDTSRSTSLLVFTFFDLGGRTVAPGAIQVDASRAFQQYFETTGYGSMFTLRAVFPVLGDSSQVGAVDVELSNSLGDTRTGHVQTQ